jgi:hypothetical protein
MLYGRSSCFLNYPPHTALCVALVLKASQMGWDSSLAECSNVTLTVYKVVSKLKGLIIGWVSLGQVFHDFVGEMRHECISSQDRGGREGHGYEHLRKHRESSGRGVECERMWEER